jgi:winged helix DNA-binding protein
LTTGRSRQRRTLSTRELNRALLARQFLLERSAQPLVTVVEDMGAVQAQYAPSAYIGLWSRMAGFRRHALTAALEARDLVQATMMRMTIHVASAHDYTRFIPGVRAARREWWNRFSRDAPGVDMDQVATMIRSRLENGPRRQAELTTLLADAGYPRVVWYGTGMWLDMVRVPPSGTWERRRADLYGLADQWLALPAVSEAEGIVHLVRRYLSGFGPAAARDIANWAGLPVGALRPALAGLELRRFSDEEGRELLDIPGAPLPDGDTPAPVRFLPTWDASLLVHCRRTQILPERYRPLVFNTRTPHSVPVFLVDGAVAGTWRYERETVRLNPFDPLPPGPLDELEAEAQRLAAFHGEPGA